MKKSNIIIFIIIILVIIGIFGFAFWQANDSKNEEQNMIEYIGPNASSNVTAENIAIQNEVNVNEIQTNEMNNTQTNEAGNSTTVSNNSQYLGKWFISQEAYNNAQEIENILERREDNLISDEEFESQMSSEINNNVVELDVDSINANRIRFDFELTSPAPTQREGKLDDVVVELTDNVGTFTYTDNWGTSGNGTITLKDNSIELKLETTSAAQGALWGVEGIYTFSYRIAD